MLCPKCWIYRLYQNILDLQGESKLLGLQGILGDTGYFTECLKNTRFTCCIQNTGFTGYIKTYLIYRVSKKILDLQGISKILDLQGVYKNKIPLTIFFSNFQQETR